MRGETGDPDGKQGLPADGFPAVKEEILVGLAEVVVPEKSTVRGEGGWMCGFQYEVAAGVDDAPLGLCIATPE